MIQALDESGVAYWLDSGTLLGLYRDRRLLPGDRDLDIGVWERDIDRLEALDARLSQQGYRSRREFHDGKLFNLTFMRRWSRSRLRLDIYVFREDDGHAWAPLIVPRKRMSGSIPRPLDRFLRLLLHGIWARGVPTVDVDRWPWKHFFDLGRWWIPSDLLKPLRRLEDPLHASIPDNVEAYLEFRYGDWRTPITDWHFWRDDGAVVRPESMPGSTL